MSNPLVSVIIPTFKMGRFIGEALESVGAQTYPRWEVIVVDDAGPEDGTRAAVEAFAAKYPDHRVEYIQHETNRGVSVARRTALEAAKGDYVAFLDADDTFLPGKLAEHLASLQDNPGCVLVHGPVVALGDPSRIGGSTGVFEQGEKELIYSLWDRSDALSFNRICNSTTVIRRACVSSGDFPSRMVFQYEDWALWLLLAARGKFLYAPGALTRYRYHGGSYSAGSVRREGQHELAQIEMLMALFSRLGDRRQRSLVTGRLVDLLGCVMDERADREPEARRAAVPQMWRSLAASAAMREGGRLRGRLFPRASA